MPPSKRVKIERLQTYQVEATFNWRVSETVIGKLHTRVYEEFRAAGLEKPEVVVRSDAGSTRVFVNVTGLATSPQQANTALSWAVNRFYPNEV